MKTIHDQYFLGGELSGSAPTDNANFASGASTAAFTDKLSVKGNVDLSLLAGVAITDTSFIYGRIGLSYASITANLNTPTGFSATYVNTNSTRNAIGGALGLGFRKFVTDHTALFTEYTYHDYGTMNFPNFQNFTATYSHSAHVYTQNIIVGISYAI